MEVEAKWESGNVGASPPNEKGTAPLWVLLVRSFFLNSIIRS